MTYEEVFEHYKGLLSDLKLIVRDSELRVISDKEDELFLNNVNYFVKSYLISICTYLEAYLQDVALICAQDIGERVKGAKIPQNYVRWFLNGEVKKKDLSFEDLDVTPDKKQISDQISGNPHKTISMFRYLGLDLAKSDAFNNSKDAVSAIVTKRNNIIHHNDEAMDISFNDLCHFADVVLIYMRSVLDLVCAEEQPV